MNRIICLIFGHDLHEREIGPRIPIPAYPDPDKRPFTFKVLYLEICSRCKYKNEFEQTSILYAL